MKFFMLSSHKMTPLLLIGFRVKISLPDEIKMAVPGAISGKDI